MKLICIEEHAVDPAINETSQGAIERAAPYMKLQGPPGVAPTSPPLDRPSFVDLRKAAELGANIGQQRIDAMNKHGIDMQVMSYSSPAQYVPEEQAVALAKAANDRLASAISLHPTRLSGFAALPWQVPDAAVDELDRAVTELGLKGVMLIGRPGETFLDDSRYIPVLKKLNDLAVPLYVHPFAPLEQVQRPYYGGLRPEVSAQFSLAGWGWHHEAGVHVVRMILSGLFDGFPHLQVISGHWGEMVPFYLARLDDALPTKVTGLSGSISEIYRRHIWVTPSGMFNAPHFEFVRDVVGIDRLIWSVDYPYVTLNGTRTFLNGLALSGDDFAQLAHSNAERLLGL